jgi:beta-aspartyl-peptidase (threonine type)
MSVTSNLAFSGGKAVVVVHGGAGAIQRAKLTATREKEARDKLTAALKAGHHVISEGGSSLDAVVAAVKVLEDASCYNAGRGSCLSRSGKAEMDAAVMDGTNLAAGAVAGLTCVKNPVTAARAVMEHSEHVFLVGAGANAFSRKVARAAGLEIVSQDYFKTARAEHNLKQFLHAEAEAKRLGLKGPSGLTTGSSQDDDSPTDEPLGKKYGTVGAVAVDRNGHVAAATSTGGIVAKSPGRVGDSPIIGAGTFADNQTCALSATGTGEHFIRGCIGHEASSLIRYLGLTLEQTAEHLISETLPRTGGDGGVILINAQGDFAMRFNTLGMYRGVILEDGTIATSVYGNA